MLSVNDVRLVMVGKSAALSTGAMDELNKGEVGAFTPSGVRINGSNVAAQDKIVLALKMYDGTLKVSDVIEKAETMSVGVKGGQDDQESIDYIGYNGTSGDIEEINHNNYIITVYLEEYFEADRDGRYNKHMRATTGETADKHAVVQELAKDGIRNLGIKSKDSEKYLKSEVISAATHAALGTGTATSATIKFTKGSPYVTGFADVSDATGGTALAVGNFIKVGTTDTSPLYKIVEMDTTSDFIKLDSVYQGETDLFDDTDLKTVTATAFDAAAVGLKISSLPLTFDINRIGRDRFKKVKFTITATNFGDTLSTSAQSATKGINTAEEVAEHEYAQQGFEFGDNKYQIGEPNLYANKLSVDFTEDCYDAISIRWRHRLQNAFREDMSYKEIQIFTPNSTEPVWLSTSTNGLRDLLESFFGLGATGLEPS